MKTQTIKIHSLKTLSERLSTTASADKKSPTTKGLTSF